MAKKSDDPKRIYITPSAEIMAYLDELAEIGIHGKTRSEVAKTFVGTEVERMIREGIITLRNRKT